MNGATCIFCGGTGKHECAGGGVYSRATGAAISAPTGIVDADMFNEENYMLHRARPAAELELWRKEGRKP